MKLRLGVLASNTLRSMFWQGIRLVSLAGWIILAARALGPDAYGVLAGATGVASALAGWAGLGAGMLMYQRTASDRSMFGPQWTHALVLTMASSLLLAALLFPLAQGGLGIPGLIVAMIALSEIIAMPITTCAAFAFSAHERMGWAAALPALNAFLRLSALILYMLTAGNTGLGMYLVFHLAAAIVGAVLSWWLVHRLLQPGRAPFSTSRTELLAGASFASGWFTANATTTLDKAMVLRAGGDVMAGHYAASYRFAAVLALPLDAMVMSAMPRLFRAEHDPIAHSALIRRMLVVVVAYSTVIAPLLWFTAPLITVLLGHQFIEAGDTLRWMGAFILLYGLRQVGCNVLVGRGHRMVRAAVEAAGLAVMGALAILCIPRYGLEGALGMLIGAEAIMAACAWLLVALLGRSFKSAAQLE